MFSTAIKSLSSNISSHYSVTQPALFQAGPWSVYDAKRRNTGSPVCGSCFRTQLIQQVSVFTFDKRKLDSVLSRSGGDPTLRQDVEEICARLRKEAGYLAKLRHPSVLELVEPVEESRSSISFVTERVTACLTSVIERKASGRTGSYDEVDEIEIQKGLLQLAKGLEFVHFSAGIVHINLVPSAVFVNAKSDWKLSGFGFAQALKGEDSREFYVPSNDQRLPPSLQFDLDYSAPELVIDHFVDPANDMFSIGCLIQAIYSSRPPLNTNQSLVTYKNTISQALRISRDPRFPDYMYEVLPLLLTRRPTDRMSSRDFQDSKYFDNILINTIRFLDAFPAKTPSERHAFMRGLPRVLPQFPKSVQQKKILPTLLDELDKDESMVGSILTSVLEIGKNMTQAEFSAKILPGLKKMKDVPSGQAVLVGQIEIVKSRVTGKEFKEVYAALASPSPSIQEKTLSSVPQIAQNLDFQTIKNDIFPKVSAVFQHTSSLAVKVGALTALRGLISGGLDKYTISEKLVPLLNGMKTREPTVIMKALEVYQLVVPVVDPTVLATDVLPHLWTMAVSPMLKSEQFREFMSAIHKASDRIETEHGRKLAELDPDRDSRGSDLPSTGDVEKDFEALVLGRAPSGKNGNGQAPAKSNRLAPQDTGDFDWADTPAQPAKLNPQRTRPAARPTLSSMRAQTLSRPQPQARPQQNQSSFAPALTPQVVGMPNGSDVWSSTVPGMRTTSVGSVGLPSAPGTYTLQSPVLSAPSPPTTRQVPNTSRQASATTNGFVNAFASQDNPWQSVSSATGTKSIGSIGNGNGFLPPPPPSSAAQSSGFGLPQLVPQVLPDPKQKPSGFDKYASLL